MSASKPELRLARAWQLVEQHRVRPLPMVKHEHLVGIITEHDLKRVLFPCPTA